MTNCSYCGKDIGGILAHNCKYCGKVHCSDHLLPESHECKGLEKHKRMIQDKWKKVFIPYTNQIPEKINEEKINPVKKKISKKRIKEKPWEKIKNYFIRINKNLIYWLNRKQYNRYDFGKRSEYLITNILICVASIIGLNIFYANAIKLNEIKLWFINLGGVLILVFLFFTIKFGLKLLKELINILKRQKNGIKYIILFAAIFLLWQGYSHKEEVLNPFFEIYNQTNFSLLLPFNFEIFNLSNFSDLESSKDSNSEKTGFLEGISRNTELIEERILILVNEERQNYGARNLISKTNLNNFAKDWSDKMMAENFFEHSNLNFAYSSLAGENIGETPIHYSVIGCGQTYSNNAIAECFVRGWINSPGHHKNMINKQFYNTGIGVSCDLFECKATQVFSG